MREREKFMNERVKEMDTLLLRKKTKGSGCGSVGKAVAYNTVDLRFESCHRQFFLPSSALKRRK